MADLQRKTAPLRQRSALSIGVVAAILTLAFAFQGSRGIYTPDEGYYVGIGQSMWETGDWLIPRLQGEPWLDKPPLSLWGIAAGLRLLGRNEWGARAFHATCFALTVLLVFFLARSLGSSRQAWLSAVFYATMPVPIVAANVATPDTPLALWTTAAFFCFWKSVEPGARHVPLWKLLLCASFGLGFLTKGPAALIPSGAMFVFLLLQRRALRYFMTPWFVPGAALFAVLGLGWYACVARELPGALQYFLDNQLIGRTVSGKYDRNPGLLGALMYPPLLLGGALPWAAVGWTSFRPRWKGVFRRSSWAGLLRQPTELFLTTWTLVPLLVLSLASSKLPLYALPLFPALAIAAGRLWPPPAPGAGVWRNNPLGFSRKALLLLAFWMTALLGVKIVYAHVPMKEDMRALEASLRDHLPDKPYVVISVEDHLESLGFYGVPLVQRITVSDQPYPFFVPPKPAGERIDAIRTSEYQHVFICRKDWQSQVVRALLHPTGIVCSETELPFFRTLLITCPAGRDESKTMRLVALPDPGAHRSRRLSIASALHLLDAEKHLDGVLMLTGPPDAPNENTAAPLHDISRRDFEMTLTALLGRNVPFIGFESGVGSRGFGNGLVALFFPEASGPGAEPPSRDPDPWAGLAGDLRESPARWKIVAVPDPPPPPPSLQTGIFQGAGDGPVPAGIDSLLGGEHGAQVVFMEGRCFAKPSLPRSGSPAPEALPGPVITGPDPDVAYRLLEFDASSCRITAFDILGRALASFSMPAPQLSGTTVTAASERP